jgi:uncharacterized protein YkwD
MDFTPVDLVLVATILLGMWAGWRRGFVFAAVDLLTLAISLAAAFLGYEQISGWVGRVLPALGIWLAPLAFVAIFLLVHFILGSAALRWAGRLPRPVHENTANRLLGLLPGAVNGAIHAVVVAVLALTLPLGARIGTWAHQSTLAPRLAAPAEWVQAELAPVFDPLVQRTTQSRTVRPDSNESIELDFRVAQAPPRPELEQRMVELVNAERRAAGLKPVRSDPELVQVARAHSGDMLARGYFAHVAPDGTDLARRLQRAHLGYLAAGENLALAPNLTTAHSGLMRSPGHRANILRPQFGRLGVGVLDAGLHGLMVTQDFRN